jgi:hypothetical protein
MKTIKTPEVLKAQQAWFDEQQNIDADNEIEKMAAAERLISPEAVVDALVRTLQMKFQSSLNKDFMTVDVLARPTTFPEQELTIARLDYEARDDVWGNRWFANRIVEADQTARQNIREALSRAYMNTYAQDFKSVSFDAHIMRDDLLPRGSDELSEPSFVRAYMHVDDCPF